MEMDSSQVIVFNGVWRMSGNPVQTGNGLKVLSCLTFFQLHLCCCFHAEDVRFSLLSVQNPDSEHLDPWESFQDFMSQKAMNGSKGF